MAELRVTGFLPWTKAFQAAGAPESLKNARGYWGFENGHGGHVICSVWDDKIMAGEAQAFIPAANKGGYKEAALALNPGDEVIVVLRSRSKKHGKVLPTLWRVDKINLTSTDQNNVGSLFLSNTPNEVKSLTDG
jgi:hypothetical protein